MPNPSNTYEFYIKYIDSNLYVLFLDEDITGSTYTAIHITEQPITQALGEGETTTFTCAADGSETPITYKWYKDGVELITGDTLTIEDVSLSDEGKYYCVVEDNIGDTLQSNDAELVIGIGILNGGEDSALQISDIINGGEDSALQSEGILYG